jgi:murein DD-endopeptidase MepM/ murein hydrolase activator NlpD
MDEILHAPQSHTGAHKPLTAPDVHAEQRPGEQSKWERFFAAAQATARQLHRQGTRVFHRVMSAQAERPALDPLPFLAITTAIGVAAVVGTVYTPGYSVSVDGVALGTVQNPQVFERVVDRVETRASNILGYEYTFDGDVSYDRALIQRDQVSPISGFETYLLDQIGEVMKTYVLKVNGEIVGTSDDRTQLESLLEEISAPYVTEYTTETSFLSDVTVGLEYTSSDALQDVGQMKEILTANTNGQTHYEVQKGDTFGAIAKANGMTLSELQELNPDININRLSIGQLLTVRETIPFLSVRTVDHLTYTEAIECPVEEVEDSSMYQGDTKVLEAGVPGEALVEADVTYVNGKEEERVINSSTTLSEPTTKIVAVGTKPRPKTLPTGNLIWPVSGRITSRFGYRSIFGSYSYHSGLDIATAYGTKIKAADGGTVTFAGYKGSYGYLVIIDHGGTKTYYGHCSKLLVSAGDKVYQGQTIAKVGSTGRSTGNHCHFEVRVNGTAVNPTAYLP